jgi:hypothetical protein
MRHGRILAHALLTVGVLLAAEQTRAATAAEPLDDRLGIRTVPIMLLLRSDVQVDLKLDAQQIALCHRAARVFYQRALAIRGRTGPGVVGERRAIDEQWNDWLQKQLTEAQLSRLDQLDLQWEGASAMLSRPKLLDALRLTQEQKETVSKLVSDARARRTNAPPTYDDHVDLTRRAIAVLNDSQKKLWIDLLGPACPFSVASRVTAPATPRKDAKTVAASNTSR